LEEKTMKRVTLGTALCAALLAFAAHAQQYPNRPITMIVPFPPGGIADITGRPLAVAMSKSLGQTIVVENKSGAGGAVGHAHTARQAPDGYTIMTALSSITVIPVADEVNQRQPTYQMSDFTPIALVSADPTLLLVAADSPWKTIGELVADAKKRPGKISYSTSGVYGTTHTCLSMFTQAAGIDMLHVPYKGGGPSMVALLSGEVKVTAQSPGVSNPHIKSGKVRALASWGATRLPQIADIPTLKESGYDAEFYIWAGVFAPARIPADVTATLRKAVRAAVNDPEFQRAMAGVNTPIQYLEGAEFDAYIAADGGRLANVVRRMGKTQ
jgi:tripartite-type tricarboxylate transporter receptor subunit TctC